jgi:predicted RNA methylase
MKPITVKIKDKTKEILEQSHVENNQLFLPAIQLDRADYVDVNKILELLGGKWNKKLKCHIFEEITPEQLAAVLNGEDEIIDVKKTYQAFFTPAKLAQRVVELADVKGKSVLEPSAGTGNIAVEVIKAGAEYIHCIELNRDFIDKLNENVLDKGVKASICGGIDFLDIKAAEKYDVVVMNPPFTRNQDCKHVAHALKFLKDGGRLVSIMAGNTSRKQFNELVDGLDYEVFDVEEGAFKESGTNIRTIILVINK